MLGLRRLFAATLLLAAPAPALYYMFTDFGPVPIVAWIAIVAVPVSAALVFVPRLEPQILARAVMWGMLVFGTLLSVVADTPRLEANLISMGLVFGSGLALLTLGAAGLDAPPARRAFVPVAFRGVLVAILVMALADTATLLFWGGLVLEDGPDRPALFAFLFGAGGLMLVAVMGLYGLRVWGFALNVLANLAIASGAWFIPRLPNEIAACLTATAIAQLVVGMPLMKGLFARKEGHWLSPSLARKLGAVAIGGLMISSALARVLYA